MKAILTRRQLINIINREPLAAGVFVAPPIFEYEDDDEKASTVYPEQGVELSACVGCAVGQTFRNLLQKNQSAQGLQSWCHYLTVSSFGHVGAEAAP